MEQLLTADPPENFQPEQLMISSQNQMPNPEKECIDDAAEILDG